MIRYREMDDGSRLYPVRGEAPPVTDGFYRDPGNPYILKPIYPECQFRNEAKLIPACCPDKPLLYYVCQKGFKVTQKECLACIASGRRDA